MVVAGRGFPMMSMTPSILHHLRVLPDAVGPGAQFGASGSYVHPVGGGASLVLVGVATFASGPFTLTASLGGSAMTEVATRYQYYSNGVNSSGQIAVFGAFSPPPGNQTIAVNCSGSYSYAVTANSMSYAGAVSLGTAVNVSGSTSPASQSATGGDPYGAFFQIFSGYANFTGYSQNQRWLANVSGNAHSCVMGDALWQAAPVFNAPMASNAYWGGIVVPLLVH